MPETQEVLSKCLMKAKINLNITKSFNKYFLIKQFLCDKISLLPNNIEKKLT